MSTGCATRFRVYRAAPDNKVRDRGSREHSKAAAANSQDNPVKLDNPDKVASRLKVRVKAANKVATNRPAVSRATDPADVRPDSEA